MLPSLFYIVILAARLGAGTAYDILLLLERDGAGAVVMGFYYCLLRFCYYAAFSLSKQNYFKRRQTRPITVFTVKRLFLLHLRGAGRLICPLINPIGAGAAGLSRLSARGNYSNTYLFRCFPCRTSYKS